MRKSLSRSYTLALLAAATVPLSALFAQEKTADRVSIHGYLTQAFGMSGRDMVMGLTKDGTADYRRAAILARYSSTKNDNFVVQLGHRRLGDSPSMAFEDNIKVDMAFYEHRFADATRVRVGKVLMPFGIYNEIRYAGTLMPFYRAPISVYWEGTYTNETIDGVVASHQFRSGKPWEVSADVFAGTYSLLEFGTVMTSPTTGGYTGGRLQAKNAAGGQLWLTTPVEGLRVGANVRRHSDIGGIYPRGDGVGTTEWSASLDGNFEHWQFRTEGLRARSMGSQILSKYAQLSYRPIERVSLNVQNEISDITTPTPLGSTVNIKMIRDRAIGIGFFFNPMTAFKIEAHKTRGFNLEQTLNILGTPLPGSYFISSFSVSF
ncbi:MAG: hypothetical protein ABI877_01360 [Gemmatimonadaceae bacterium]